MDLHPVGLIKALHDGLPTLLPAHEVLGAMTAQFADDERFAARARGDYAFVQGRGDRIHLFLCVDDAGDLTQLEKFESADGNWLWLVAWQDDAPSLIDRAEAQGFGVVTASRDGSMEKLLDATPRPGIFIKAYPALRKEWRTLASW
ncbi:MAG: hypothetical protein ACJAYU_003623 [Bradymonadia bacterium]|jgi:hypothetical protein